MTDTTKDNEAPKGPSRSKAMLGAFSLSERLLEESALIEEGETANLLEEAAEVLSTLKVLMGRYQRERNVLRNSPEGSAEEQQAIKDCADTIRSFIDVLADA